MILSLQCPKCDASESVRENGHPTSGHQRYQCTDCRHAFQTAYSMKGSKPGMPEKIIAVTMNSSDCRETYRVLGISLTMVIKHLEKLNPLRN